MEPLPQQHRALETHLLQLLLETEVVLDLLTLIRVSDVLAKQLTTGERMECKRMNRVGRMSVPEAAITTNAHV